jgi:hypothetical protein
MKRIIIAMLLGACSVPQTCPAEPAMQIQSSKPDSRSVEVLTSGDERLCILVENTVSHKYFYVYYGECLMRDPVRGVSARYNKNGQFIQELPYDSNWAMRASR